MGSNMASIVQACQEGRLPAVVKVVAAQKEDCPAMVRAMEMGVSTELIGTGEDFEPDLIRVFDECDWICLAGFLRLLPSGFVRKFEGRILNTHPALLPKFGGKGMYLHHVHQAVLDAGETETGCTIHLVNEQYDEGAILYQAKCPVLPEDTVETLSARVAKIENEAYVATLERLLTP